MQVKKQPVVKPIKGNTNRKRGRGGKTPAISREHYDLENDVIVLDKIVRAQEMKSKSKKIRTNVGGGSSAAADGSRSGLDDPKMTMRQQRSNNKYLKLSMSDKSDYVRRTNI